MFRLEDAVFPVFPATEQGICGTPAVWGEQDRDKSRIGCWNRQEGKGAELWLELSCMDVTGKWDR